MKLIITVILTIIINSYTLWSQDLIDSNKVVKILSFNIFHGATTNGDFNLDAIAKVIKDADPDFVALQEVDFKTNRAKKYDLVTEIGWRVKMAPIFARAMDYDNGKYGVGVLSKHTFVRTRNVALPYTPGNEPRVALEVISVLPLGDTIAFVGTHLDYLENENDRVAQAKKINKVFTLNPYPTILAGDLNAAPGSNPIKILEEKWASLYDKHKPEPTFPSNNPQVKIDYVMHYPKNKWKVHATKVIQDSVASDHCAYLVTMELLNK